jgi:phage terminase Nu1 subunit (DNA packaging protein)
MTSQDLRGRSLPVAAYGNAGRDDRLDFDLLDFVQLLINQHGNEHEQEYARADAENADRKHEAIDLGQQLSLFFLHVRIGIIEKELIILMHGQGTLVD